MGRLGVLLVIVAFSLVATSAVAGPTGKAKVIIAFQDQPGAAEQALVRDLGGSIKYTYHLVPAIAASLPEGAIAGLLARPGVVRVEPDLEIHAVDAELDNSWGVKRIGAGDVHDGRNKGTGIKVAIIDSGIDYTHGDLDDNYAGGYDFVEDDNDPMDVCGHGTHVAGTAAAEDDDVDLGVVGVAPEADIYALRVLGDDCSGSYRHVIAALEWAVDNGMQVTNNSYGSSGDPGQTVKDAFDNAQAAGIIHAGAAGNSGNPPGRGENCIYPALWDSVIAVAATNKDDRRASFSSTCSELELAAPGVAVNSTVPTGDCYVCDDSGYHEGSGTSMASPHVAGTAALVIASGIIDENGDGHINDEVRLRLQQTADDLGKTGRDSQYGFGLVDAAEAAAPAVPDTTGPAVTEVDPADGAIDVAVATNITVAFSEPVNPATVTGDTFTVNDGSVNIAGTITVAGDGLSATFDPHSDLANERTYTVTVTTGVTDTSDNALDQDGDPINGNQDFTSSFTTAAADTTGPAVTEVDPADGAIGVAVATNITVAFSEPVNPATVIGDTFTVKHGSVNIAGTITVAGDGLSATFDPDSDLANETTYTVTVTSGVTDSSGNALDQDEATNGNQDFTSSFTTAAAAGAGTITGTVTTNANTGDPIEGATVQTGGLKARTDADGHYTISDVPAGTHTVRARAKGFVSTSQEVTIGAGETVTVDFALRPR